MSPEKREDSAHLGDLRRIIVEEVDEAREVYELARQLSHALPLRSFDDVAKAVGERGWITFRGNAFHVRGFATLVPSVVFPIDDAEKLVTLLCEIVRMAPKSIKYNPDYPANAKRDLRRCGILGLPVATLGPQSAHDLILSLYKVGTAVAKIGGNDNVKQAKGFLRTSLHLAELYPGLDRQSLIDGLNAALRNLVD